VFESQFGFHIVKRQTYEEVAAEFAKAYGQVAAQKAESTFLAGLEKGANVQVKQGAAKLVKAIAEDVDAHRDDRTSLATWRSGTLTAARLVQWMGAMPPQSRIREGLAQAPDSAIPYFLKQIARNELVLKAADSMKVALDTAAVANIRDAFYLQVIGAMGELKVAPAFLKDSAKTKSERERLGAARVDAYFDLLLNEKAAFINVPEAVSTALRDKYESRIVVAGIERALERATKIRQVADSTRAASTPPSAVPMPGAAQAAPQPAAPTKKP
jgi:hypothetical protein